MLFKADLCTWVASWKQHGCAVSLWFLLFSEGYRIILKQNNLVKSGDQTSLVHSSYFLSVSCFSISVVCSVLLLPSFLFNNKVSRKQNEISLQIFGKKEARLCEWGKYLSYVILNLAVLSGCVLPRIPQHKRDLFGFSSVVNQRFLASLQAASFCPSSS